CALVAFELTYKPIDNNVVEVISTKVRITVSRFYFEYPITKFQDRNIMCSASAVENGNFKVLCFFIQTISQCGSGRFVDNSFYLKSGNFSGFFGSLTLCVIEVCRNGDNGFGYFLTKVIFSGLFHFL